MTSSSRLLEAGSYARGRLQLGITGVGTMVLLAAAAAAMGLPGAIFPEAGGSFREDGAALLAWASALSLAMVPVEALGGYFVPKAFRRAHPPLSGWLLGWLRGALVTCTLMALSGATVLATGRAAGEAAALGVFGLLLIALLAAQVPVARLVGGMGRSDVGLDPLEAELRDLGAPLPRITVLAAEDEGFTGGVAGLPGMEVHALPLAWVGGLEPRALALLVLRRVRLVRTGHRAAGTAAALAWTLGGFALASTLPEAGLRSVAGLVTTSLWFTVISFIGLLVLPAPSRAGTRAADARLLEGLGQEDRELFEATLGALDRRQDDEPERSASVESVFHPIPSLHSRTRDLGGAARGLAPWHLARTAIYLSIAALNPLHRLVHCNVGRPQLWAFLPADG